MSTTVPIYNSQGQQVNQLEINDTLDHIGGRVWKGKQHYYKGVGIPYRSHHVVEIEDKNLYTNIEETGVFYLGYEVVNKNWIGKTGIFQARYQPFFPDHIGGCSIKERTITDNSKAFKRSSVEIIDVINYDHINKQYYFKMNYKCNRKGYVEDNGDPKKLKELLDYMLQTDWNFLWDKGAINDCTPEGLVTDVADLFESEELEHQLGTVYSLLYSLYNRSKEKYIEFLNICGLTHEDTTDFIYNSIKILDENGVDTSPLIKYNDKLKDYKHTVLNYLVQGRNCAYCSCMLFIHEGDMVRDDYVKRISEELKVI